MEAKRMVWASVRCHFAAMSPTTTPK